jgi:hypothetical protein
MASAFSLGTVMLATLTGCESLKVFLLETHPIDTVRQCGFPCLEETWRASKEVPTVEASLERVNTAARLIELGELMLHGLPLSAGSLWPQEMRGTLNMDTQQAQKMLNEMYGQRPLYRTGSGYQPSPWTAKALELQKRLFTSPPDLHYERTYRSKGPSETEVHALGHKVLGAKYNPVFDKVFYRLLLYHPGFEPKRELFSAQFDGKAVEFYPNVMEAVFALAENRDDLLKLREAVLQAEETREKAYRDVEESAQRIRQLKAKEFGHPATPEEAAQKSEDSSRAKDLQDLENQFGVEKQEYDKSVAEYATALQQLSVALGQIKHQAGAFTPEQRALAVNIQAVVDTAQGLLGGTRTLLAIAGIHLPRAVPKVNQELRRIAIGGGDLAVARMKRIYVNSSALPMNVSVVQSESGVLDKDSQAYNGLFVNRVNAPTVSGK